MTLEDITRTESNLKDRLTDYIIANYDMDLIQKQCKAHIILDLPEHLKLIEQSENVSKAIFESVCNAVIKFEGMKIATEKQISDNPYNNTVDQMYVKWQLSGGYIQIASESKKINVVWTCPLNDKNGKWSDEEKQNAIPIKKIEPKDWSSCAKKLKIENNFVTFLENDEIWYYDVVEGIYKPFGDKFIAKQCQKLIDLCDSHTVYEVINTIRRSTYISSASLLESIIPNTQNGILDTNTFEVKPHSPEYLSTTKLPFSINHNARNLKLWNHILSIIDPYDINKFMEMLWGLISWNNPKKEFIFKGEANTQKSALVKIITWIIGEWNLSKERSKSYLQKDRHFATSHFIGKRGNIETEIGGVTKDMLETKKSMIGGELQNTEKKNDNKEYTFNPEHFTFISTTNDLGGAYSLINDDSAITRYQFLICRNQLKELDNLWHQKLFSDEQDRQSAIDTIVSIVINYKKAQSLGNIPETKWSSIEETKQVLKEQMPKEDKYFEDERIIKKDGSRLTLEEIKEDFESFTGLKINNQAIGIILKKNGIESKSSNGKTIYKGYDFNTAKDQTVLSVT